MKLSHFFTVIAFAASASAVEAQTPINTVPEGITTFNLPATGAGVTSTSYYSAPLINDPVYTGAVSAVTSNTVTVGDTPPPWTSVNLAASATPYFVKFLSGAESGRILQVTGNTSSSLTLDITDNTTQSVALTASNYAVAAGDTFEVFAGDTLALMFGTNTAQSPLVLKGGGPLTADSVSIFIPAQNQLVSYYFNTTAGQWEAIGCAANANNTIMRPYSGFAITRHSNEPATSFVLTGRVAEVNHAVKTTGGNSASYDSTGYPVDVQLSQLQLVSNWQLGTSPLTADTISIYNTTTNGFDVYFEVSVTGTPPNTVSVWHKVNGGNTNYASFVIPAATTVVFTRHQSGLTGSGSFVQPTLPYSLTN